MRKNIGRVMLLVSLVAGNLVLGRGLFAQGGGCDRLCQGYNPSCWVIATGSGGTAQSCQTIQGQYSCGGSGCQGANQ